MSRYDPQGIYSRPSEYTKKGQIIQKKPQSPFFSSTSDAMTDDEIPRAIQVLLTFGYIIFEPGHYPSPAVSQLDTLTVPFAYNQDRYSWYGRTRTVKISELWNYLRDRFSPLLSFPIDRVISSQVNLVIDSFFFGFLAGNVDHQHVTNIYTYWNSTEYLLLSENMWGRVILFCLPSSTRQISYSYREYDDPHDKEYYHMKSVNSLFLDNQFGVTYISDNSLWPQLYNNSFVTDYNIIKFHDEAGENHDYYFTLNGSLTVTFSYYNET